MKNRLFVLFSVVVITHASAQDVSDIINQISSEKEEKKSSSLNSSAIQPVRDSESKEGSSQSEPKKENKKTKGKTKAEQSTGQASASQSSRILVYRAKDKLPKDVAGSGVAGDFLVTGEDAFGGASIIAAEDAMNPFARTFIIKNISSGYSAGTVLALESRKLIRILPQKPLIFIGRDILPGQYQVRAQ